MQAVLRYRAEIDGLRALAVVPVILFHAGFDAFSGGFIGVDIFFVISGYLITGILLDDLESGCFSLSRFYERRARRILPALFLIMACCLPFAWAWMLPSQLKEFSSSLVAVSLFFSNVFFWQESGYFAAASEEVPLLHTWSLAVEEQFYLLFPLLLPLLWRYGRTSVIRMLLVLAGSSLLLSEWSWKYHPTANFYLLHTRAWELFAGSLAALWSSQHGIRGIDSLAMLGLVLLCASLWMFDAGTPHPGMTTLVPVLGTVLLILFANRQTLVGKLLSMRPLVGIGLVSYSAYLWHQPLFAFARLRLLEEPGKPLMLGLSLLSLGLAAISWRLVEMPFRRRGGLISERSTMFRLSFAGLAFFVLLGWYGVENDGFADRFSSSIAGDTGHEVFHRHIDQTYQDCEPGSIAGTALEWDGFLRCKQSGAGRPQLVLLGDSHAEHLFPGLAEAMPEHNVAFYVRIGNPYLSNSAFRPVFEELLHNETDQTVILTMHFVSGREEPASIVENLGRTIAALQDAKKQVILVGDVPQFGISASDCLYRSGGGQVAALCGISAQTAEHQRKYYHLPLTRLSEQFAIPYVDISQPLCNEQGCSMLGEQTIYYRDSNHLNIPGSRLVGHYLLQQIRQLEETLLPPAIE